MEDLRGIAENVGKEFLASVVKSFAGDRWEEVLQNTVATAMQTTTALQRSEISPATPAFNNPAWSGYELAELAKAVTKGNNLVESDSEIRPRGRFFHPYAMTLGLTSGGTESASYREYPNRLTFDTLKSMAQQTSIITAIINTRVSQMAAFARPPRDRWSTGYRIRLRDRDAKLGGAERKRVQELERFILHTGYTKNPATRDTFEIFLRKLIRDSLTFDQAVAQVVPKRRTKDGSEFVPAQYVSMDASTFRIAQFDSVEDDVMESGFVQVIDGEIVEAFDRNEILWFVRNPRTDIKVAGYGFSELEQMITVITSILFSEEYNRRQFYTGSMPKGFLMVKAPGGPAVTGNVGYQEQLEAFRRQWWTQVAGVQNSGKVPVVSAPGDMSWVNLERGNKDMEWNLYHEMLIKIACAVYQIDPSEINFDIRSMQGAPNVLNQGSSEYNVKYSKDKGLMPLLRNLEDHVNSNIIWPIDENFCLEFVGLDASTEKDTIELKAREVTNYKTVNEVRKDMDLKPLKGGEIILNGIFTQQLQMAQQQEQQEQEQGQDEQGNNPFESWQPGEDSDFPEQEDEDEEAQQAAAGGKAGPPGKKPAPGQQKQKAKVVAMKKSFPTQRRSVAKVKVKSKKLRRFDWTG